MPKLIQLNFEEQSMCMIESYLSERTQTMVLSSRKSQLIHFYQSLSQETVSLWLLSNVYKNNRNSSVKDDCNLFQYADDAVILTWNKNLK